GLSQYRRCDCRCQAEAGELDATLYLSPSERSVRRFKRHQIPGWRHDFDRPHEAQGRDTQVPRIVGAFAAGRIMNTRTARSQLMGGMIWGISSALHEATEVDPRNARYINDNLADYLVPVNADIDQVEVILVPEEDEKVNPAGVKGIGELGNVGTAAAVANAVFHATGKRIRELPMRLEKLL
ncbi:MAG: xanthine dehydrogenase family protein molybdopterin-binding subunit, partial [Alphaproteobacteria bacterium]